MANKSAIRFFLLGLPILTAFSLPAGHRSDTAVSPAGLPSDVPAMIMQAFPNDFGDAPASYGSASHVMDGRRYLGGEPDGEASHQYSDEADGDDLSGRDDEDGVTIPELAQGKKVTIRYQVATPYATVYLNAWIDWNGDGDFNDNDERIASNISRTFPSTYSLDITVPDNAIGSKPTFARFRLGARINTPTGTASSGEVEDYMIKIACVGPEPPKGWPGSLSLHAKLPPAVLSLKDFPAQAHGPSPGCLTGKQSPEADHPIQLRDWSPATGPIP